MWAALALSRDRAPLAARHYRTFEEIERPGIALARRSTTPNPTLEAVETAPHRAGI
ncbi:hypothetical protein K443DRAFT_674929 [Laccaria amethystina LaAM-08-1]|uniref:Uncharacterized protein n=1 Tax=Laccaria amethystina LaAM-08-1 TaxID=1095629 RepID=A0A0C9XVL0_9AGAR|nr:hypothetical protein K443DRAFT_674929 [Laccaria amethystina LaAM-08-1]